MKRSDVFEALVHEANEALTGNCCGTGGPLNTYVESFTVLLSLRSVCSPLFGYSSPEYSLIASYLGSLTGSAFIGPVAVQP